MYLVNVRETPIFFYISRLLKCFLLFCRIYWTFRGLLAEADKFGIMSCFKLKNGLFWQISAKICNQYTTWIFLGDWILLVQLIFPNLVQICIFFLCTLFYICKSLNQTLRRFPSKTFFSKHSFINSCKAINIMIKVVLNFRFWRF